MKSERDRTAYDRELSDAIKAIDSDQPHAYAPARADYTSTCQQCGRGKGSYLHTAGITLGGESLGTNDPWEALTVLAAQRDAARMLVHEILDLFDPARGGVLPGHFGQPQIDEWREMLGPRPK